MLTILATACSGLFAGAAVYITFVEHPARFEAGGSVALLQWRPSYRRATKMQASLAALGTLFSTAAWFQTSAMGWLVAALSLASIIALTLVVIFPTNKRLLDPVLQPNSAAARELLTRWGRLHAVRSLLGVLSFAACLLSIFN
jgi:hypothetical protein